MAVALSISGVAFAAVCVWLAVRIVNRRERWAKWTLAAVLVLPVLYVLSAGPACWLCENGTISGHTLNTIYSPIGDGPEWLYEAINKYALLWVE
jgi:hypothetical protein